MPRAKSVELTERQTEVLRLVAAGRSNGEIAEILGISLDGAKWHVSEILSKLGVDSREEAARLWRSEHGLPQRLTRALRLLVPGSGWVKVATPVFAAAALSAVVAVVVVALQNSGPEPSQPPATAPVSTPATASPPAASPTPTAQPRLAPSVLPLVSGVFKESREAAVDRTVTLSANSSPSRFTPWDGMSTLLYDVLNGKETNLGPGSLGSFSHDGRWFAWVAGTARGDGLVGEAAALELSTGRRVSLGTATRASFVGPETVALFQAPTPAGLEGEVATQNILTGQRQPMDGNEARRLEYQAYTRALPSTPDGFVLFGATPGASPNHQYTEPQQFEVRDGAGAVFLRFDAYYATSGGTHEVIAAYPTADGRRANYFAIDVFTGTAKFIATVQGRQQVAVNDRWVAISEGICYDQHSLLLIDRNAGDITRISLPKETTSNLAFSPVGQLVVGNLVGFAAVIEPASLRYVARVPDATPNARGGYIVWSPDFRYASRGWALGPTDSC